jgi:hypothetical protein
MTAQKLRRRWLSVTRSARRRHCRYVDIDTVVAAQHNTHVHITLLFRRMQECRNQHRIRGPGATCSTLVGLLEASAVA